MICPMCRAGLDEPLDYVRSFPGEPWHEIIQNITGRHHFLRDGSGEGEGDDADDTDVTENLYRFLRRRSSANNHANRRMEVMHAFFSNVLNQNVLIYPPSPLSVHNNEMQQEQQLQETSFEELGELWNQSEPVQQEQSNSNQQQLGLTFGTDLSDGPVLLFPNTRMHYGHANFADMTFRPTIPRIGSQTRGPLTMETEFSIYAVFSLYRNEQAPENSSEENPNITLHCNLTPCRNQRGYTIQPTFARVISTAINDLNIRSLSASIFARSSVHVQGVQIATMRRMPIQPPALEIRAEVSPPIYSIHIVLSDGNTSNRRETYDENNILNLIDFMFLPQQPTTATASVLDRL